MNECRFPEEPSLYLIRFHVRAERGVQTEVYGLELHHVLEARRVLSVALQRSLCFWSALGLPKSQKLGKKLWSLR